jgi:hypothetical protein
MTSATEILKGLETEVNAEREVEMERFYRMEVIEGEINKSTVEPVIEAAPVAEPISTGGTAFNATITPNMEALDKPLPPAAKEAKGGIKSRCNIDWKFVINRMIGGKPDCFKKAVITVRDAIQERHADGVTYKPVKTSNYHNHCRKLLAALAKNGAVDLAGEKGNFHIAWKV